MRNRVALLQNFGNGFFLFILQDDFPLLMAAECPYKTESKEIFFWCWNVLLLGSVCGNSWYAGSGEIEPSSPRLLFFPPPPPQTGFCSGTVLSSFFASTFSSLRQLPIMTSASSLLFAEYIPGCGKSIFI